MRFLANENVIGGLVRGLRELGHDIEWIAEFAPGSSDEQVLARARVEPRILLTFDQDFGELAFRLDLPTTAGIVLLRIRRIDPASDRDRALRGILQRDDFRGVFAIVEDDRLRIRELPAGT